MSSSRQPSSRPLTKEQKGKAVVTESSPARDETTNEPLQDLALSHLDALRDMRNTDTPQRTLVADSVRLYVRETGATSPSGENSERDRSGESAGSDPNARRGATSRRRESVGSDPVTRRDATNRLKEAVTEYAPILFRRRGRTEVLPPIPPEARRPPDYHTQDWRNYIGTKSTIQSVKDLLSEMDARNITFLIPTQDERPWSPPVGYQCVYEGYFGKDARLWFPIPRVFTAYAFRRRLALSQLNMNAYRLAFALMVLGAEIGMALSVRAFEELTSIKRETDGMFTVKMRPRYNIITGHPNKTPFWWRKYFYVKSDEFSFEEPPNEDYRVYWNHWLGSRSTFDPFLFFESF